MGTTARRLTNGKKIATAGVRPAKRDARAEKLARDYREALEQQAATADILQALSRAAGDPQPVFDAIAEHAYRLCGAVFSIVYRYDGRLIHVVADRVASAEASRALRSVYPTAPTAGHIVGRMILEGRPMHSADVLSDRRFPANRPSRNAFSKILPYRAGLAIPLQRNGTVLGGIAVARLKAAPFTRRQISLLRTFADQAMVALENARLFQQTNEALEHQRASAEILRVVSESMADAQPVFDAILAAALGLFAGFDGTVWTVREASLVAMARGGPTSTHSAGQTVPITAEHVQGRAILQRKPIRIDDVETDRRLSAVSKAALRKNARRALLIVPLLRQGEAIGAISVSRTEPFAFTDKHVALLENFADQAVIAIENARLFNETKEALERQRATSEILRVIAGSPSDVQPVFDTIVRNFITLSGGLFGTVFRLEGGSVHYAGSHGFSPEEAEQVRAKYPVSVDDPSVVSARAIRARAPIHVADVLDDPAYDQAHAGVKSWRQLLAVPMLRDGVPLGAIVTAWVEPGSSAKQHLELLQTFADQAVIAIENVRLFNETKEALERQTATAEVLRVISSTPADTQPVFQAIVRTAARLFAPWDAVIMIRERDRLLRRASAGPTRTGDLDELNATYPVYIAGERHTGFVPPSSRAVLERRIVEVEDVETTGTEAWRNNVRKQNFRSVAAVPLLRGEEALGTIGLTHPQPRQRLNAKQLELLRTFADQAVIAIENVRLFNETKEALEQQTAISEVLRVISASPGDVKPVLDAVAVRAARICEASDARIYLVDGVSMRHVAGFGDVPVLTDTVPLNRGSAAGRSILDLTPVQIDDIHTQADEFPVGHGNALRSGWRTVLAVPLIRENRALGAIVLRRTEVRPFTDKYIGLLKTFADQAAIAIENVRLFNETKEALERQTATAEVLRVISSTPADTQPVFEAIVESAQRLLKGKSAILLLRREKEFYVAGYSAPGLGELPPEVRTAPLDTEKNFPSRVILNAELVHIPDWEFADIPASEAEPIIEFERKVARAYGIGSGVQVPLMRQGEGIGALAVTRAIKGPFHEKEIALLRSFADQAVIAIENSRLFNETKEALEQQTAISEVLRVISSSPADVKPVLQAVAERAARICEADDVRVFVLDGDAFRVAAGLGSLHMAPDQTVPLEGSIMGRVAQSGLPLQVDVAQAAETEFPWARKMYREHGHRIVFVAPLLREGRPLGAILMRRPEERLFTDKQIALLKTFADQAAIAIENVRLFNETKEALERQTATAEILRVIAGTPSDAQPVFDAIAQSAMRVFDITHVGIALVEGDSLRSIAAAGARDHRGEFRMPLDGSSTSGRAILGRTVVDVPDVDAEGAPDFGRESGRIVGFRAASAAPLLRDGATLGAIVVMRGAPGPFPPRQLELLQTFADQAVIAIENARLFAEIRQRNDELKRSLDFQAASAEILAAISRSIADTQPVFDAIVKSGLRLLHGHSAAMLLIRGDQLHLGAYTSTTPEGDDSLIHSFPMPLANLNPAARAASERRTVAIEDVETDNVAPTVRQTARSRGWRSALVVPLLRQEGVLGVVSLTRREPGPFAADEVALVETFAAQAVIAIENARLFNETKEALERQTATAEILKVISGSVADTRPVFEAIVAACARLFPGHAVGINLIAGDGRVHLAACDGPNPEVLQGFFAQRRITANELVLKRQIVHFPDVEHDAEVPPVVREGCRVYGSKAIVYAPMRHAGRSVGALWVARATAGRFSDKETALLATFADQAVIAIENARLFNETKEALEQQTATAEVLGVISSSPTSVAPVYATILENATRLCEASFAAVFLYDGTLLKAAAYTGTTPEFAKHLDNAAFAPSRETATRLAALERRVVHVEDVQNDPAFAPLEAQRQENVRSVLSVPMLREGALVGVITVWRREVRRFSDKQVALLKTFADQAVIAIENVRLFNETKEALEQQTATAGILRVISASPSDVQPVFDAIARSAVQLCGGIFGAVFRYDGKLMHFVAQDGFSPEALELLGKQFPLPPRGYLGWAITERVVVHLPDVLGDPRTANVELVHTLGYRGALAVPMLREGEPIGVIVVFRREAGPFSDANIGLLKTFADQAVIAIENVRLFNETKEALERQTATAEVLRVISSSPTDVQPVFEAIAASAMKLFGAWSVAVGRYDGELIHLAAVQGARPETYEEVRKLFPVRPNGALIIGRAILTRGFVEVADAEADESQVLRDLARARGYRSLAATALVRNGEPIGAIAVSRKEPGGLAAPHVELLKTFADQAVIAVENARLFRELQSRTEALTKSVGQLTALREVGQAISSTLELETVLKTIVSHAVRLAGFDAGVIYEYDEAGDRFELRAWENFDEAGVAAMRGSGMRKGEGAVGKSVAEREPVQVPDTHAPDYPARLRGILEPYGYRALLAVPLAHEEQIVGALLMIRRAPGAFPAETVELLKTLGAQSALAIQNARLYREIEQKGRELEAASRHKSHFLASMSHELRTPLNAILGFNEMIIDEIYGEVPADMKDPLANIQTSGKHLLRLINNVLDLAKIEAGRMELALADYAVQDAVASVHTTLKPLAAEKGLEFLASVPAELPLAYGDAGRIAQCLMNLAGNSLKFTKSGKVEITVAQRDEGWLRFCVADTGIGIPPEKIGSLFTEFKQTDATIASEYGGTGLGLSITKKFIEMHGGRAWVESELGKGSQFLFEIPLRVSR